MNKNNLKIIGKFIGRAFVTGVVSMGLICYLQDTMKFLDGSN